MSDADEEPFVTLVGMAREYRRSRALFVVAELGVADLLADGARGVDELAATTETDVEVLYRLLRALASVGVFHESGDRRFALTPMGEHLRSDHPRTVRPLARLLGADYEWAAWGDLLHSVRTGENAAAHALGMNVWEYRRRHPADNEVFDAAMRTFSESDAPALLAAYDFGRHQVIADIGGGTGGLVAAVLGAVPHLHAILFDQPQVVAHAELVLADAGVADRVEVVGGSFFESVPTGADAYVLRRILHDWTDEDATAILRCLRRSVAADARLVLVDAVVGPPNQDPQSKFLDLGMLVSAGGRERTEAEWASLLEAGGFRLVGVTPATASSYVLEAVPQQ